MTLDLVLHVGLAKTATTTLQTDFFPRYSGYLGGPNCAENLRDSFKGFTSLYIRNGRHRDFLSDGWKLECQDWWRTRPVSSGPLVLSSEELSVWMARETSHRHPFLEPRLKDIEPRRGTHPLIFFLTALSIALGPEIRVRVVLAVRNQVDFSTSLYAELAQEISAPSQAHFEKVVRRLHDVGDEYMDWNALARQLQNTLGPQNLLLCFYERGLDEMATKIASFIGQPFTSPVTIRHLNSRRTNGQAWVLSGPSFCGQLLSRVSYWIRSAQIAPRQLEGSLNTFCLASAQRLLVRFALSRSRRREIAMSERLAIRVRLAHDESNRALGSLTGADLSALGY